MHRCADTLVKLVGQGAIEDTQVRLVCAYEGTGEATSYRQNRDGRGLDADAADVFVTGFSRVGNPRVFRVLDLASVHVVVRHVISLSQGYALETETKLGGVAGLTPASPLSPALLITWSGQSRPSKSP